MMRASALFAAGVLALAAGGSLSAAPSSGTISGSIDSSVPPPYGSNAPAIVSGVVVAARDSSGRTYGTLSYGKPVRDDATNVEHVPFRIAGVPLDTPLTVTAGPAVAAQPSPEPSGFFMTFTIRKERAEQPPRAGYAVTLTRSVPHVAGIDFVYAAIEVPPALPGTPAP